MSVKERLEYLRGEIEAERISYGEISELRSLAEHIDPGDTLLLEWAESDEEDEPVEEYCEMSGCDWEACQERTLDSGNKISLCYQCSQAFDLGARVAEPILNTQ